MSFTSANFVHNKVSKNRITMRKIIPLQPFLCLSKCIGHESDHKAFLLQIQLTHFGPPWTCLLINGPTDTVNQASRRIAKEGFRVKVISANNLNLASREEVLPYFNQNTVIAREKQEFPISSNNLKLHHRTNIEFKQEKNMLTVGWLNIQNQIKCIIIVRHLTT